MTRRGIVTVGIGVVVLALVAVGTAWWWTAQDRRAAAGPSRVPTRTVPVTRTNLSSTIQLSAIIGFAGSYTITGGPAGTITTLPQPGQVITQGQPIYEVDGEPVYLLYGTRASWRVLASGVTDGSDVQQLEQNLITLGYADPANLTLDNTFTWATSEAIRRWQRATHQPITGQLALGRVIYEPGPIRVVEVAADSGAQSGPGTRIATATSTAPLITASVPPAETVLLHAGDPVTITLPTGRTAGRVDSVSTVAIGVTDSSNSSRSGPAQVSVPASISLTDPAAAGGLDQAPVTVNITDRTVNGVLAVPVTALVALAGGGYAVWVDADGARRLVAVTPGLFATTLVQVTAAGLNVGDLVEIPRAMTATLELDRVSKSYPPPTGVTAVADVTLSVDAGEAVAITGPSGSGKSTLLNLLGTIERPTSGAVRVAGSDTSTMSDRRLSGLRAWRIGFVFQQFHLLEHLSVLDNVATGLLYRGWGATRRREYAYAALERVGLDTRSTHRPSQLSGGERQRTAIARAVAGKPDVILADEPTGNLDSGTGAGIVSLLAGLVDADTVVIVITHDPAVASAMGRQVQLRDGRIVHDSCRP